MHENDAALFLGDERQHVFIGGASGDIVDAVCARFETGAGDAAAGGVDRDWNRGESVAVAHTKLPLGPLSVSFATKASVLPKLVSLVLPKAAMLVKVPATYTLVPLTAKAGA